MAITTRAEGSIRREGLTHAGLVFCSALRFAVRGPSAEMRLAALARFHRAKAPCFHRAGLKACSAENLHQSTVLSSELG